MDASCDIESARGDLVSAFSTARTTAKEPLTKWAILLLARAVSEKVASGIANVDDAVAFVARNPQVLAESCYSGDEGMPIWEQIKDCADGFVTRQLGDLCADLFVSQFEPDFDPVDNFRAFGHKVVDDFERVLWEKHGRDNDHIATSLRNIRAKLSADDIPEEMIVQVDGMIWEKVLSGKYKEQFQLVKDAFSLRTLFTDRLAAMPHSSSTPAF